MKRILALVLLAVIMVSAAVSCSDNNKGTGESTSTTASGGDNAETETTSPYADDDLGEYNFEGYEFHNIARTGNNMDVEEEIGDALNDSIYLRNRKIEERFNFKFTELIVPSSDMASSQRVSLLAGDKSYDIMVIRCPDAYTFAQEGLLHPMSSLPYIDIEKPYWDEWVTNQWSIANQSYFIAASYDIATYSKTVALLFNKKLANELGLTDLYDIAKEGKWTYDKFSEVGCLAKSDLNGDGVYTSDDQHAYLGTKRFILPAFWTAGNVKTIEKDSDDIPYLAALDPKFVNVWDKLVRILVNDEIWFDKAPDPNLLSDPLLPAIFKEGRALFYDSEFTGILNLRDMDIDFGILPYPKYDENQEKYVTRMSWAEMVSIPLYWSDEELERTSIILEALACESAKTVIPTYYELALKTKGVRDEESEAMIDLLFNARVFDWGDTIWSGLLRDGIFPGIFPDKADTMISSVEKAQTNIQATIDKMVDAFLALE